MIEIIKSEQRGYNKIAWLESWHSFSFGSYYNPERMGFRNLRVINEDFIAPRRGFPTHTHNDMEIITYLISGNLAHKDSTGEERTLNPGQVQFMSAGSGVSHSEYSASQSEPTHLLQIWIQPAQQNLTPSYAELPASATAAEGLNLIVSPTGEAQSLKINQDVKIFLANMKAGTPLNYNLSPQRAAWIQVVKGTLSIEDNLLGAGDAVTLQNTEGFQIEAKEDSVFLLFDLN